MPRAELRLAAAATIGAILALAPLWAPYAVLCSLVVGLPGAAERAPGRVGSPRADLAQALGVLAVDPELRASRALYDAALRSRDVDRLQRLRAALASDTHRRVLAALAAADVFLDRGPGVSVPHRDAGLAAAAAATGVDLAYLRRAAAAESSFNPYARAPTSSARGLFQFIDQTWLRALAKWGARHGRPLEARWVRFDRAGRAYVPDPAQARAALALRYDPDLSARMAAELARENATVMAGALSRPVGPRELHAAHLLGLQGALRLIRAAEATPDLPAADLLPEAAASNARLFYEGDQPRSVATLLALFS